MDMTKFSALLTETVIEPMLSYMESCTEDDADCGYSEADVARCGKILMNYLNALSALNAPSDADIMTEVEQVVLALNRLSEENEDLIETAEREAIWQIIQDSAVEAGLSDPADDVTEEWREW